MLHRALVVDAEPRLDAGQRLRVAERVEGAPHHRVADRLVHVSDDADQDHFWDPAEAESPAERARLHMNVREPPMSHVVPNYRCRGLLFEVKGCHRYRSGSRQGDDFVGKHVSPLWRCDA